MELNKNLSKVKPSGIRKLFDLAQNRKDIISFGIGEPDFITPDQFEMPPNRLSLWLYSLHPNAGFRDLRKRWLKK